MPTAETEFERLVGEASVPGMSSAVIRDGRLDRYVCCGVRGVQSPVPVDEDTVFEAASLSKPVFAHAVLQLADQGRLALDAPLGDYLPQYIPADERASSITAGSCWVPGWCRVRHATRPAMRAPSRALPRRRALCTNWKKPR